MRISFVSPPVSMSGGIKVIGIYAEALQKRGHKVCIVSAQPKPMRLRRKLKSLLLNRTWPQVQHESSHLENFDVDHRLAKNHVVTADDLPDADVVIATWWETAEWVNLLPPQKGKKVYFIQGWEIFPGQPEDRVRATWRMPMQKITISDRLMSIARDEFQDSSVIKVPNGVDLNHFRASPRGKQERPTVGFLFTDSPVKGIDICLKTLEQLKMRFPQLRVISFGAHQPERADVLPPGTWFSYRPEQDQIPRLYAQCDVWLCGSRSEGFHLPPLEAMACRCPVVSTKVGGPMDIIRDGENGFLVDVEDVPNLVERVADVLQRSETNWRKMSDAAWATAKAHSWEHSVVAMESALLGVLNAPSPIAKVFSAR